MKTKVCRICKKEKPFKEFSQDKTHKDNLHSECKKCSCKYEKPIIKKDI